MSVSVAEEVTRAEAVVLDELRAVFGPGGDLVFESYEQSGGASVVLTVTSGWGVEQKDATHYTVTVTEQDGVTAELIYSASRVTFGDVTAGIAEDGISPPVAAPRKWLIKVSELRGM